MGLTLSTVALLYGLQVFCIGVATLTCGCTRVPILVDPAVFARASLSPEGVLSEAEAQYQFIMHTVDDSELELQVFRTLL